MNRDLENGFGQEDERLRSRSRRRDAGAGSGSELNTASTRRPGGGPDNAGMGRIAREAGRPGPGTSRVRQEQPDGRRSAGPRTGAEAGSRAAGPRTGVEAGSRVAGPRTGAEAGSRAAEPRTGVEAGSRAARPRTGVEAGSRAAEPRTGAEAGSRAARPRTGVEAGSRAAGARRESRVYSPEVSLTDDRASSTKGASLRRDTASRSAVRETAATDRAEAETRKFYRIVLITMIVLELIILPSIFMSRQFIKKYNMLQRDPNFNIEKETNPNLNVEKYENMKGYWTVALFGVDSRNNSVGKGNNADVIIIANVNQDNGEIKLVSIFRDTYLNLDDQGSYNKINQAYFRGGPEQAIKALNKNLDIQIDDYATFNWKAVADAINILGGVDVELSKAEFYYINAYITETVQATGVGSRHLKSAGANHLDGVQAVAYARLRKMDTDFARTERQREIIQKSFDKLRTADFAVINNVMEVVFKQILTSVTLDDIIPTAKNLTKYTIAETVGFPMQRSDANMGRKGDCVIPQTLESNVITLHQFLFDDVNYQPSDMVKKISSKISADSGLYNEGKYIDKVGTDGGYIPKPTESTTKAPETTTTSEEGETEVSTSPIDDGIIDGEYEWDLETDEFGNVIDPPESEHPGPHPGATRPSGSTRPGGSDSGTIPYPGYTTSPTEESTSGSVYPGSTTSPDDGMTGPGATTTPSSGNTMPTRPSYPGSTTPTTPSHPGNTSPTTPAYPGSTNGTTPTYPGSTTGDYVPGGPGSVIIGPGN